MSKDLNIVEALKSGAVGLLPSDTIYGLSCSALNQPAIERIFKLKGRGYDKLFIVLISDFDQVAELHLDPQGFEPVRNIWPAPLTLVVATSDQTPKFLRRTTNSLAVRMPNKDDLRKLLRKTGPLVSTSANPSGQPPAETVDQARAYFGDRLDFYVDAGPIKGQPSTVAKINDGRVEVLRQGAYKLRD
ncbi:MAG TPA: L-threonylcarbamoyladenylate synthase [Candidatus Saccharimonadales bacterium]|nr:L-threonylcarbamoyladenylate synthase [Candidatus Saccharimonadales bacterium]